jgi:hypothetical protein
LTETLEDFVIQANSMLFNTPATKAQLKTGDLIKDGAKVYFVVDTSDKGIKTVDPVTASAHSVVNVKNMFGMNFYTKVTSFFGATSGSSEGSNPFGEMGSNPMMMMAMMNNTGEDSDGGGNEMFKMMAMSQMMGGQNGSMGQQMNPMMMMAMMGNKGGSGKDEMFKMMMMSNVMAQMQAANNAKA